MPDNTHDIFPEDAIPPAEIAIIENFIRSNFGKRGIDFVRSQYEGRARQLYVDAFGEDLLEPVKAALIERRGLSAVRIGDGEANFLALGAYEGTTNLDRHAFAKSIANQQDCFRVTETWMLILRELMQHAVASADIVGVLGLWRPPAVTGAPKPEEVIARLRRDLRGIPGHFRGIDLMLRWARQGRFQSQIIAPAHFYFSVLAHLDVLMALTKTVFCITDQTPAVEALCKKFPACAIMSIPVGTWSKANGGATAEPGFLTEVEAQLPSDMTGSLCLIGAGVWAEFYCTWVKTRGGVAVDIGSGFDLMAGQSNRPIHRMLPKDVISGFRLSQDS
jgi:hypothetical protein